MSFFCGYFLDVTLERTTTSHEFLEDSKNIRNLELNVTFVVVVFFYNIEKFDYCSWGKELVTFFYNKTLFK